MNGNIVFTSWKKMMKRMRRKETVSGFMIWNYIVQLMNRGKFHTRKFIWKTQRHFWSGMC